MCLTPITIENPFYRSDKVRPVSDFPRAPIIHNFWDSQIQVPCGHCADCLRQNQSAIVQRFREMSKEYYMWFFTLTYDDQHLSKLTVGDFDLAYADVKDIQLFIKTFRRQYAKIAPFNLEDNFSYWITSEFGSKYHRPHWHGFFFFRQSAIHDSGCLPHMLTQDMLKVFQYSWSVKTSKSNKYATREPRCQWIKPSFNKRGTFDFHLVDTRYNFKTNRLDDVESVAFYTSKYCLKFDDFVQKRQQALKLNLPEEEYRAVWSIIKPHILCSKGFGLIENSTIPQMIDKTYKKFGYPCYTTSAGETFPLGKYLKQKYLTLQQVWKYDPKFKNSDLGDIHYVTQYNSPFVDNKQAKQEKFSQTLAKIKKYD